MYFLLNLSTEYLSIVRLGLSVGRCHCGILLRAQGTPLRQSIVQFIAAIGNATNMEDDTCHLLWIHTAIPLLDVLKQVLRANEIHTS